MLMTILFIIQCLLYEFVSYFSLFLPLKMSGPLGPHTYIQMQKGTVFHFTLHCCNTVLMTILFIIQCLLYEFVLYFSLSLPLKMSGPLGPHTYIQMQKGTVFHFTLHSMFTVLVCLILLLFTLFTFKNARSTGPTYLYTKMQKGAVFHFTLHCCNTVLMTILFIIQCLLYEFVSYFSLFLPLKMSGPLGPRTYIQMQKGTVFHFTLHSMFTVLVHLILFTFHSFYL